MRCLYAHCDSSQSGGQGCNFCELVTTQLSKPCFTSANLDPQSQANGFMMITCTSVALLSLYLCMLLLAQDTKKLRCWSFTMCACTLRGSSRARLPAHFTRPSWQGRKVHFTRSDCLMRNPCWQCSQAYIGLHSRTAGKASHCFKFAPSLPAETRSLRSPHAV